MTLHRRAFLGWGVLPLILRSHLLTDARATDKRIVQSADPVNLEFPFASLDGFKTRTELHYVRNHYAVPDLDPSTWRLSVTGAVKRPLSLSLEQLQKLKSVTRPVTLECAGNGRSLLEKKVKGVQWGLGAVSTADWTGVPLREVLELAGVEPGAVEVILDASDKGDPKKEIQPTTPVSFARSLPLAKALAPETILAWGMNGADLPANHGRPVRVIVPGWYGMASVKWLKRLIVIKKPFWGFDQTIDYAIWSTGEDGLPRLTPITEMQIKASIARPFVGETLPGGKEYRIHGAAWAGESDVSRVEVSTNGGKSWSSARLLGEKVPFCWRLWEYRWTPSQAGNTTLMARAFDRKGQAQPTKYDTERRSYMLNFVQPIPVSVKG